MSVIIINIKLKNDPHQSIGLHLRSQNIVADFRSFFIIVSAPNISAIHNY